MLFSTTPDRVGPVGITVFFFLIFLGFFVVFDLIWRYASRGSRQPMYSLYLIAVLAGIPTLLIGLQSLNQLQVRDVVVVVILALILIFYLSKRKQG